MNRKTLLSVLLVLALLLGMLPAAVFAEPLCITLEGPRVAGIRTRAAVTSPTLAEGNYVNRGDVLAKVSAPTKYFSVEGSNLYFQLTKDGEPVNPEGLFR